MFSTPHTVSAFELELIGCVGGRNYVLVNVMAWLNFWVLLLFCMSVSVGSYYWQWRLSGAFAASFCYFWVRTLESIFKAAMETIVFVVAVIGAAGRARLCYFCRESAPDTHTHSHPCTHTHTHRTRPQTHTHTPQPGCWC